MKLCHCKKNFIREEIESVSDYDQTTEAIAKIVESDCVCDKKEEDSCLMCGHPILESDDYFPTPKGRIHTFMLCTRLWREQLLGEQPQSPCEHGKYINMEGYIDVKNNMRMPVFLCSECGLVTCKNPNE